MQAAADAKEKKANQIYISLSYTPFIFSILPPDALFIYDCGREISWFERRILYKWPTTVAV